MARRESRRIRDNQQRGEGKQCALGKEKAAATCLEQRKRKKTNLGFTDFRHYALECRNVGMPAQRERERERWRPGNRAAGVLSGRKGRRDPRFVALEFVREKKAMVRNGECGAEQRDEGLTSRGVAWICKLIL